MISRCSPYDFVSRSVRMIAMVEGPFERGRVGRGEAPSGGSGDDRLDGGHATRRCAGGLAIAEVLLEHRRDLSVHKMPTKLVELPYALPLGRREVGDDADPVGGDDLQPAIDRAGAGDQRISRPAGR